MSLLRRSFHICVQLSGITPRALATHRRPHSSMAQSSPFTCAVVSAMRRLYPENLADKSFDNTGLLLEAPYQSNLPRKSNSVLLTIDLTKAVADEAVTGNHSVVVAYHPIIFRGLKAITLNDTQQASLLRLAANGTSVYSPHTAVDIVPGGMADWLCDIVAGTYISQDQGTIEEQEPPRPHQTSGPSSGTRPKAPHRTYSQPTYIAHPGTLGESSAEIPHTRSVVTPSPDAAIKSANAAHEPSTLHPRSDPYDASTTGAGRLVTFKNSQPLSQLIHRIASAIGNPKAIQIAIPQTKSIDEITIKSIGLCPGSGSSVLRAATPSPDLIFTGEMSHHEALAVIERGGVVITLGHSNSERGYLNSIMKSKLQEEVKREWDRVRQHCADSTGDKTTQEMLADENVEVVVSKMDRDPFGMMVLEER